MLDTQRPHPNKPSRNAGGWDRQHVSANSLNRHWQLNNRYASGGRAALSSILSRVQHRRKNLSFRVGLSFSPSVSEWKIGGTYSHSLAKCNAEHFSNITSGHHTCGSGRICLSPAVCIMPRQFDVSCMAQLPLAEKVVYSQRWTFDYSECWGNIGKYAVVRSLVLLAC